MTSNVSHTSDASAPLEDHGIPYILSVYASWGDVVVGVITPAACVSVHNLPGKGCNACMILLPSHVRRGQRRPRLQCPGSPVLSLQALCHRPLTSPHRCANGREVSELEEAPNDAPPLRASMRCRGGGVWRRWRTTAMCQRRQACHEECQSLVRRASPRQVPVALRRHRGVARIGECSERQHAHARHRTARRAFGAMSCLRDTGARWRGYVHLSKPCGMSVALRTLAKLPRLLVFLYQLR
jgi:hypothetical protein